MLVCKMLGICCARLPRRVPGTAGAARGGGAEPRAAAGAGRARAASAARSAACLGAAVPCAHVTKFGLSRDPSFVAFLQLEFTSMLSRTPPPLPPALPFSPLS